jgi:hypothetical protein
MGEWVYRVSAHYLTVVMLMSRQRLVVQRQLTRKPERP